MIGFQTDKNMLAWETLSIIDNYIMPLSILQLQVITVLIHKNLKTCKMFQIFVLNKHVITNVFPLIFITKWILLKTKNKYAKNDGKCIYKWVSTEKIAKGCTLLCSLLKVCLKRTRKTQQLQLYSLKSKRCLSWGLCFEYFLFPNPLFLVLLVLVICH